MKLSFLILLVLAASLSLPAGAQNLLLWYNFQDGTATDLSGNGYHPSLLGNSYVACDASGNCVLRTGKQITDYVTIPSGSLDGLNDFSIEMRMGACWFNIKGTDPMNTVLSASSFSMTDVLLIAFDAITHSWNISVNGSAGVFPDNTMSEICDDGHCLTLTREAGVVNVYNKNQLLGSVFNDDPLSVDHIILGQYQNCPGGCFQYNQSLKGGLDFIKVRDYYFYHNGCNGGHQYKESEGSEREAAGFMEADPNPFSSSTTVSFSLEVDSHVTIELFDVAGRKVDTVFDDHASAGSH